MTNTNDIRSQNPSVISLSDKFELFTKHWTPKVLASCNDQLVKIAKVSGEFVWHKHDGQDELFLVVKGRLIIDLQNEKSLHLNEGEMTVIPKGMEHRPRTHGGETWILMVEPPETHNTGQHKNERSVERPEWI